MRILIVTPAPPRSRKGNRITALRWAHRCRELGHQVALAERYDKQHCDLLIALHALRSHDSIERFARERPHLPLVVALTGTDLYRDLRVHAAAGRSLDLSTRIVLLQVRALCALPKQSWRAKSRVIFQSAVPAPVTPAAGSRHFDVCVLAHLRPVKDPFRAALASRGLPAASRIRIVQVGAALSQSMEKRALSEARRNPRYRWLGELPPWKAMRILARSRLVALTSRMEGGANAISEAIANGKPIVASRIDGSVGILGSEYPGYFPVGDTRSLTHLLHRAETDEAFYERLVACCASLRPLVAPERERARWAALLAELA